jgi:hypothetical protein
MPVTGRKEVAVLVEESELEVAWRPRIAADEILPADLPRAHAAAAAVDWNFIAVHYSHRFLQYAWDFRPPKRILNPFGTHQAAVSA